MLSAQKLYLQRRAAPERASADLPKISYAFSFCWGFYPTAYEWRASPFSLIILSLICADSNPQRGTRLPYPARFAAIVQNSKMLTDSPPQKRNLRLFLESDRMLTLPVPSDARLPRIARAIEQAMRYEATGDVRRACDEFLAAASEFYRVPRCSVRVLAARP